MDRLEVVQTIKTYFISIVHAHKYASRIFVIEDIMFLNSSIRQRNFDGEFRALRDDQVGSLVLITVSKNKN